MKHPSEGRAKLDILALPSQTAILFWLIVAVVLGTVLVGSIGRSPIPVWPLALGLTLLPLRTFLARPERDLARHGLSSAGDDLADLQQAIKVNAVAIGLRRTPQLIVSPNKRPLYTFGTFRHWYIALSHETALRLQASLEDPDQAVVVQAKLVHELYHFKTGDYWQMGYVRELLRTVFLFMTWAAIFFCGYSFLLFVAAPDFVQLDPPELVNRIDYLSPEIHQWFVQLLPSPAEMAEVRQKAATINFALVANFAVSATMPFVMLGGTLWGLYWPKLWRLRELYADAGVVQTQGEIIPYLSALTGIPVLRLRDFLSTRSREPTTSHPEKHRPHGGIQLWWKTIKELPKRHPGSTTRIACVKDPRKAFDSWGETAILAGSLTLLLDILLVSPLTLLDAGRWPMHFSTLAILVVVSLNLIPYLVQGKPAWPVILKVVAAVVGLRLVWLILTLGLLISLLIFAPDLLDAALAASVAAVARFAGYSDELAFDDLTAFVVQAAVINLAQVFIVFIVLIAALFSVALLLRRLLTWYGLPHADQSLMKVAYAVIGLAVLLLSLTILPPITTALLRPADLLHPLGIATGAIGIIITTTGLALFLRADKRYARRCPNCDAIIPGQYRLGKICPTPACSQALHPWLTVEYES
jgi:hypothetical protein